MDKGINYTAEIGKKDKEDCCTECCEAIIKIYFIINYI